MDTWVIKFICVSWLIAAPVQLLANVCDQAAQSASQRTGVPVNVLMAITRTETGTKKFGTWGPWPWTVNVAGKGAWFSDYTSALRHAQNALGQGRKSFDVGCFQLNYKWHSGGFASLETMFRPEENALYAANFLAELKTEFGTWTAAAGAYHSRNPKYANKYKKIFEKMMAQLPESPKIMTMSKGPGNKFPLFSKTSQRPVLGSLVAVNDLPKFGGIMGGGS